MSVRRVMGIETEYGILVPGEPAANPMLLSGYVVNAYATNHGTRASRSGWDYEDEAPLRDARGFEVGRQYADPSQLTDDDDPTLANVVLTNGARLYVDHAHPEYSSPEVMSPLDAVRWDRAGELVMREAVGLLSGPGRPGINLYKNNTDGKGASYGTHENFLMRRETPFADIVRHLIPFFVARQVMCGAGRVGIGTDSTSAGYQISQRADFFEVEVGLETTLKRPIINTRDEPHAQADRYRRLHVILGDANSCDVANLLKVGSTSLVLAMIEDRELGLDIVVDRPVASLQAVSHDASLTLLLSLRDGRKITALDLLWLYFEQAAKYVRNHDGEDPDADTAQVLQAWESVLTRLGRDPMECAADVDWVGKLALLQGYRDRDGLAWSDSRLRAIDFQWSDVRADKGLANRLAARGRITRLVDEELARAAVSQPPADTRAYFRGRCLDKFGEHIAAASWDSVIFEVPGQTALQRVPMLDPHRGTAASIGDLIDRCDDVPTLLSALGAS